MTRARLRPVFGPFAAATGQYQPLSRWLMRDGKLEGYLQMPLPLGAVGGAIGALPLAQAARRLGGYRDLATMQQVIAAFRITCQNLAALRAFSPAPAFSQAI